MMFKTNPAFLILIIAAALLLAICESYAAPAQTEMKVFKKGEVYIFNELGVSIIPEGDKLKVDMVFQQGDVDDKDKINIKVGDYIIMMNGKSLKSISDVEEGYEIVSDGDKVQLGVKRGKDLFIVSFDKAAPVAGMKIITKDIAVDDDGKLIMDDGSPDVMEIAGAGHKMFLASALNLLLEEKDNALYVSQITEIDPDNGVSSQLKEGDRLLTLQNENIESGKQFMEIYDSVKYGKILDFVFERDGDKIHIITKKQKSALTNTMINHSREQK